MSYPRKMTCHKHSIVKLPIICCLSLCRIELVQRKKAGKQILLSTIVKRTNKHLWVVRLSVRQFYRINKTSFKFQFKFKETCYKNNFIVVYFFNSINSTKTTEHLPVICWSLWDQLMMVHCPSATVWIRRYFLFIYWRFSTRARNVLLIISVYHVIKIHKIILLINTFIKFNTVRFLTLFYGRHCNLIWRNWAALNWSRQNKIS